MKSVIYILFFLAALIPTKIQALPSVESVQGGFADSAIITIQGTEFGSHNAEVEWLGGRDGNIEQGTNGEVFSRTGWQTTNDSAGFYGVRYSRDRAHSGFQSLISQWPQEQWGSEFGYLYGKPISSIYATWWAYFDHVDTGGQWKMWRLRPTWHLSDTSGEIMSSVWYTSTGGLSMAYVMLFCDRPYDPCYPGSDAGLRWLEVHPVPPDRWVRLELFAVESTSPGVRDGSFIYKLVDSVRGTVSIMDFNKTVITRGPEVPGRWQYFIFQNYWGNNSGGPGNRERVFIDDVYIQIGTRARIEVGNSPSWSACTQREIQPVLQWSPSVIQIKANNGSFNSAETKYLYVIDENGNVNQQGFELSSDGVSPAPPENLRLESGS